MIVWDDTEPANPATYWVNNSETQSFTYKTDCPFMIPFYVRIGTESYTAASFVLFASSRSDVPGIIKEWIQFQAKCQVQRDNHDEAAFKRLRRMQDALSQSDSKYTAWISEAPTNQLYKVSWTRNDTL